ncbi:MAG: FAD-binding protein [Acidimicrobiia bacterium]
MQSEDIDVDVLVAGAGAAGLAAAIAAADTGASVALLEAMETFRTGNNTSMSTSMIPAGGSRWQEQQGLVDSPDLLFEDIMTKSKGTADPVVSRALADVAPTLVAWLADTCKVPLELVTDVWFPGNSQLRHHCVPDRSGRSLHRYLLEAAGARPSITLVVPSRVEKVDETESGFRVTTRRPDGSQDVITVAAVVLATNGFGADKEMVDRYIPEIANGLYFGGDGSRGDALRIGQELGADSGSLGAYQGHGSVATPHGVLLTWTTMMNGAILVNTDGHRFQDETIGYSESAVNVLSQPGNVAWAIYDRFVHDKATPFADYQDLCTMDAVRWNADVPGLAATIAVDGDVLAETMSGARKYASASAGDPFGRANWAHELEPPYAAVKVTGALFHTQGGLRVNESGAVLRQGVPIDGLFPAGGAAIGVSGDSSYGYLSGNGLLSALGLGYLSGRAAGFLATR